MRLGRESPYASAQEESVEPNAYYMIMELQDKEIIPGANLLLGKKADMDRLGDFPWILIADR